MLNWNNLDDIAKHHHRRRRVCVCRCKCSIDSHNPESHSHSQLPLVWVFALQRPPQRIHIHYTHSICGTAPRVNCAVDSTTTNNWDKMENVRGWHSAGATETTTFVKWWPSYAKRGRRQTDIQLRFGYWIQFQARRLVEIFFRFFILHSMVVAWRSIDSSPFTHAHDRCRHWDGEKPKHEPINLWRCCQQLASLWVMCIYVDMNHASENESSRPRQ